MSENLLKNERDFVVPGDEIVNSMEFLPGRNSFSDGNSIYSKRLGLVHVENHVISVVPLSGGYMPLIGDMVIGELVDVQSNGWIINIDSAYDAYLPLSGVRQFVRQGADLSKIYAIGEIMYANDFVTEVIKKIEKESHIEGLTDNIEKLLAEKGLKFVAKPPEPKEEQEPPQELNQEDN